MSNKDVAEVIMSFEFDGKIDGEPFSVKGNVIYDNAEVSKAAFYERRGY